MIEDAVMSPGAPLLDRAVPVAERHGVDCATFEAEIVGCYRPVVLRGIVGDWPAARAGESGTIADYLLRFADQKPVETFLGGPEIGGRFFYNDDLTSFNFAKRGIPLRATIEQLVKLIGTADPPAIYAGAMDAPDVLPGFADANPLPLIDAAIMPRVWIGNAVTISTHYDLSDNIACVAAGRRRFVLFPPDQIANLYVGPLDFTMAGQPVSLPDPDAPDLVRYPRFAEALAHAQVAELGPGDAIFIPSLWWHQVRSFGALNVLVNYWWGNARPGPFEALIHGLLAVRDLPAAERAAWRSVFEHYLFQDEIDPAAHLPEAGRGILGAASPARTQRIRAFLSKALSLGR